MENKNGQDKIAEYAKDLTDADHITTNAMGKAFGYLTTGEHTLELNADGYEAQNEKIEVKDETNNLRIMLKKSSTLPDVKPSAIPIESLVTEPPAIPSLNPDSLSTTADIMISLGEYHSGAVTKDGSLYMWGCNDHGQLGDNTITDKNKPVKVLDNVVSVSLGGEHSGAITKDGSLYMWGLNNCGQLGDGTVADAHKPVKVLDNVALVSLGYEHSGAVTKDGSLYMWGYNGYGQLGDGTETDKHTPVKVLDNVASVSLGGKHSGAVTKDGSLYMWGYNCYGQLGDGTRTDKNTPVKVLDNVASVSLGGYHSGAVTKDGSLYMWGNNSVGCLGDGTNTDKHTPVKVLNNVASVSLGDEYRSNYSGYREDGESGAVTKDGSLYMWGSNYYLQLGIESTDRPTKMFDNVISVSLGGKHSGAVTKDGSLYMWGSNGSGQLGDGTTIYKSTPVKITFEDSVSAASYRSKPLRGASTLSESFTGLLPDKYYNVYVLKSRSAKNLLSADNVLYMAQYTTDSTGKIDVTYNINKTSEYDKPFVVGMSRMDLSDADVKVKDLIYSGKEQSIWPEVSYNGKKLSEREDYNVSGDVNVTDIGEYSITISGTGMYKGSITIAYKVKSPDGSMPSKTFVPSEDTSGDKATAAPSEDTSGDKATSTPSEDTSSDKATDAPSPSSVVTAPGTIPVTIVTDGAISVPTAAPSTVPLPSMTPEPFSRPDYDDKYEYDTYPGYDSSSSGYDSSSSGYDSSSSDNITVKLGKNTFIYNGKAKKPKVTVKQGSYKLIKNRDYTLTYSNNVNVGTASVTVWSRGDYSGYILKKFTIIPKGTSFSGKIKAGHRSFTAKWKKRSKSVTGYQLQYSSNKKFNGKTTKTIKKKSVTKLKAGNLKAGKKYYIRVRTYKTVKGRKYCSKWSKTKIVKTKR
ncbi:MAG TPA: hypothetical protein DCZ23_03815 [Lachnospiraceae bacterium]|nr:hypothetical protein [Lachnospiraceae bacterium]